MTFMTLEGSLQKKEESKLVRLNFLMCVIPRRFSVWYSRQQNVLRTSQGQRKSCYPHVNYGKLLDISFVIPTNSVQI